MQGGGDALNNNMGDEDEIQAMLNGVPYTVQATALRTGTSFNDILEKVDFLMDLVKNKEDEIQQLRKENAQLSLRVYSLSAQVYEMNEKKHF